MSSINLSSIVPSRDTVFMRGFSSRQDINEIRDFFTHEGSRNTVEFLKEDPQNQLLYIALRFDSHAIAKDIISRYENTDVLGDRVTMQFYKDLRNAPQYHRPMNHRQDSYQNDSYDYRGGDRGGDRRDRFMDRGDRFGDRNDRGGGYMNRRGGNSYQGPGMRRGGGWQRGGGGYHHPQQSMSSTRPRRYNTRSSSRSRSASHSRSSSRSDSRSSSGSGDRHKRKRSLSDSTRKRKAANRKSEKATRTNSYSLERTSTQSPESSALRNKKSTVKKTAANSTDAVKEKNNEGSELEGTDTAMDFLEGIDDAKNMSAGGGKNQRGLRSSIGSVAGDKQQRLTGAVRLVDDGQQPSGGSDDVENETSVRKDSSGKDSLKPKKLRDARRQFTEEQVSGDDETSNKQINIRKSKDQPDEEEFETPTRKSTTAGGKEIIPNEGEGGAGTAYESFEGDTLRVVRKKKQQEEDLDGNELDYDEEEPRNDSPHDQRLRYDDAHGGRRHNAVNGREADQSMLSLSQNKVALIRSKKEDIEKAYRQDCETFATVTKMLISKDPELEERIQQSLRDNLKEIGQRCILELREFVERVKSDDDIVM